MGFVVASHAVVDQLEMFGGVAREGGEGLHQPVKLLHQWIYSPPCKRSGEGSLEVKDQSHIGQTHSELGARQRSAIGN